MGFWLFYVFFVCFLCYFIGFLVSCWLFTLCFIYFLWVYLFFGLVFGYSLFLVVLFSFIWFLLSVGLFTVFVFFYYLLTIRYGTGWEHFLSILGVFFVYSLFCTVQLQVRHNESHEECNARETLDMLTSSATWRTKKIGSGGKEKVLGYIQLVSYTVQNREYTNTNIPKILFCDFGTPPKTTP